MFDNLDRITVPTAEFQGVVSVDRYVFPVDAFHK